MTAESEVTHRQASQLLMVPLHAPEHLLAVAPQLVQLLLDDRRVQRLALLHQLLALGDDLVDLTVVQRDLLLESLGGTSRGPFLLLTLT